MSKPNRRRVRMSQFSAQVAEAVLPPDGVVEVELDEQTTVSIRLPLNMDADDEYVQAIRAAEGADDLARVVLGDEQLEVWKASGRTADEFAVLFGSESRAAQERLRDFRYRP